MRIVFCRLFAMLAAVAAATASGPVSAGATAPAAARAGIDGDWRTVIASPRRPWIFVTRFEQDGAGWAGRLVVPGLAEFPLSDVRLEAGRVRFRLPSPLGSPEFEGALRGDSIVGTIPGPEGVTAVRLARIVPLPPPASRAEAWRQDLAVAAAELPEDDRSFTPETRGRFREAIDRLERALPGAGDAELLVGLSQAVALAGNAHTWLRMDPTRQGAFTTRFPIRIWWFDDGPYVIRAAPRERRALRCRVVAIDGHDVAEARDRVATLFAGNAAWRSYLAPLYLTCPDALHGLGLIANPRAATYTLEDPRGGRFELPVAADTIDRASEPRESWQMLSPLLPTGTPAWASALPADPDSLPRYLRHPERAYGFDFDPGPGLLYFQFSRSENDDEGPGLAAFGGSLLAFARAHAVRDLVIDLRFNSGGDLTVARDFIGALARDDSLARRGHCFVITGHCTFSAGLYHAAQLRQAGRATFVGEAAGDRLDFWAEGGEIVLPNSGAAIGYANGFHRYSTTDYPQNRPYYAELRVASLGPDVPAPLTSAAYFARRDPALEAIEARIRH